MFKVHHAAVPLRTSKSQKELLVRVENSQQFILIYVGAVEKMNVAGAHNSTPIAPNVGIVSRIVDLPDFSSPPSTPRPASRPRLRTVPAQPRGHDVSSPLHCDIVVDRITDDVGSNSELHRWSSSNEADVSVET